MASGREIPPRKASSGGPLVSLGEGGRESNIPQTIGFRRRQKDSDSSLNPSPILYRNTEASTDCEDNAHLWHRRERVPVSKRRRYNRKIPRILGIHSHVPSKLRVPSKLYVPGISWNPRTPSLKHVSLFQYKHHPVGDSKRLASDRVHLAGFSISWQIQFAELRARFASRKAPANRMRSQRTSPIARYWASKLGESAESRNRVIENWNRLSDEEIHSRWKRVILYSLSDYPVRALEILVIANDIWPKIIPRHAMVDCLHFITSLLLAGVKSPHVNKVSALHRFVCNLLKSQGENESGESTWENTIFLLAKHCDKDQLIELLRNIRASKAVLHTVTVGKLAERFVDFGDLAAALDVLHSVVESGTGLYFDHIQSLCVRLLRTECDSSNKYVLRSNILARLLQFGIRPNRQMCNVIILNAMEAGDHELAWRFFEIAKENGLKSDAYTYTALLKGVQSGSGREFTKRVIIEAQAEGLLDNSRRLIDELLYAIYLSEKQSLEPRVYEAVLPIYLQFYDAGPLRDLGVIKHLPEESLLQKQEVTSPSAPVLGLVVLAYLQQYCNDPSVASTINERYHQCVLAGHSTIAPLAETDHTANALLMALGQHPQMLSSCTKIVEHMLKSPSRNLEDTSSAQHPTITDNYSKGGADFGSIHQTQIAQPTIQTWSILLLAFVRHGQVNAAEKILKLMKARNIEPNDITWNTLIGGYAKLQNTIGIISSLQRMERAGFGVDDYTLKSLSGLVNRTRLFEWFEKATNKEEMVEDSQDHNQSHIILARGD
ncbi:hypothetical protein MMC20_006459 [Loxospora ochrophaea]|nr:hypothetical protein [Loxospora ochrophaea]